MTQNKSEQNIQILEFIQKNPTKVVLEPLNYANVLTFGLSDKYYSYDVKQFPDRRLHVLRMPTAEIQSNHDLLTYFFQMTAEKSKKTFENVWLTTSHLTDLGLLLVELSFE
ncbi:hypothetical protein ACNAN0_08145 [Agrilactobacillus fermenti]|uniref:hypothetical protein n=1 Tax=Agrilactobacillus fermenti TaxID=2586909 RepID=UPI001E416166|nr:hypothetical protein [Agrilactobacillus fermenti]MCD2257133.1 hypothetical protein [Agrilactobacillus fermenti]